MLLVTPYAGAIVAVTWEFRTDIEDDSAPGFLAHALHPDAAAASA